MKRTNRLLLAFCLGLSVGLAQVPAPGLFTPVREKIQKELEKGEIPSIAVAVARRGKVLWEEAFGWANREKRIRATPRTPYSLASISKPITATGLMILVERGLVDLDRPVDDYLGRTKLRAYAGEASRATIRRVASHSAGLPLHYQFFMSDEDYPRPSMEETIRHYGILVTRPGEKFQYSNIGFGILDYVIERVSGKSYPEFMREEVFEALGLRETFIPTRAEEARGAAVRYFGDGTPLPFYDFDHRGGSAVFSSAHDLLRFGMFHLQGKLVEQKAILSRRSIRKMQKPVSHWRRGLDYGLGWMIFPQRGGYRVIHHGGSMGGVRTQLSFVPSEEIVVVVLANTHDSLVDEIHDDLLGALLLKYREEYARQRAASESGSTAGESVTETEPQPLSGRVSGVWSGEVRTYQGRIPFKLWLKASGAYEAQLGDQERSKVKKVAFEGGYLTAEMSGDVGTPDANRRRYVLRLSLKLEDDSLSGSLTAVSIPGPRLGNALTSWAVLERESSEARTY